MQAVNLKTNHLTQAVGIDDGPLFLSWQCDGGVRQSAYEIELAAERAVIWKSGKVQSSIMHADAPAAAGGSRVRGSWNIRLWDENDVPGPWASAVFETGLNADDWQGLWVDPETEMQEISGEDAINRFARTNWERKQAEKEAVGKGTAEPYVPHCPASYLRKSFTAHAGRARLYITARGLYVAWLNGVRVGDMVLAPGSFTGDKHLGAQTYDVTQLLRDGENELLIALGDGWHRSTSGVDVDRNLFGDRLGVLFQLEVDGKAVCVSDETMQATQRGPIRQNDLQQGEVYDARLEGELTGWHSVRTDERTLPVTGMNTVPIREQEAFPGRLFTTPNGETVLDFGQNLAGYVEMELTAHEGQKVLLICGETLDENGNFTQENFQDRTRHKEGGPATMFFVLGVCLDPRLSGKTLANVFSFLRGVTTMDLERRFLSLAAVVGGNVLYALTVKLFILLADLVAGGTTGLALTAQYLTKVPISAFVLVFNVCMLCLGWAVLGRAFAATTLVSTFLYPVALEFWQRLLGDFVLTDDVLLCTVFSGLGIGVSLGVVIRAGASTGGMDIPPLILNRLFRAPVSATLYAFDVCILLSQGLFQPAEKLLYGVLFSLIYSLVLDKMLLMGNMRTEVKVISPKSQEICRAILEQMDRGVTLLEGESGYLHRKTRIVLSIVSNRELPRLEKLVRSIDPESFLVISRVTEVKGRGFSLNKNYRSAPKP